MISALVTYLDPNEVGTGFYVFAQELGELSRNAFAQAKLEFWGQDRLNLSTLRAGTDEDGR